jgi:AcrR family transcriptional regulator
VRTPSESRDTRQRLVDAYITLTNRTSGVPTVADVVRAANVNRSTFYAHFSSIADLTLSVLDSALTSIYDIQFDHIGERPLSTADVRDQTGQGIVSAVVANRTALAAAVAVDRPRSRQLIGRAILRNNLVIIRRLPGWAEIEENRLAMLMSYLAHGWSGVICAWLAEEIALSPAELLVELLAVNPDGATYLSNPRP